MDEILRESKTTKGSVRLYDSGIMHQTYHKGVEIIFEDTEKEMEIYRKEFCQDGARPILVDINTIKSVSKESRGIYSSKETAEIFSAAALLVGNPVSRIMGNFYLGLNKSTMPVRMFTDPDQAWSWLITFIK